LAKLRKATTISENDQHDATV